jgi:hypothetical protein
VSENARKETTMLPLILRTLADVCDERPFWHGSAAFVPTHPRIDILLMRHTPARAIVEKLMPERANSISGVPERGADEVDRPAVVEADYDYSLIKGCRIGKDINPRIDDPNRTLRQKLSDAFFHWLRERCL